MWRRHVRPAVWDALNANIHFHSLVLDGVYASREDGHNPEFHQLPPPEDEDVVRLVTLVSRRVQSLLDRRGFGTGSDPREADPLSDSDPGMSGANASPIGRSH